MPDAVELRDERDHKPVFPLDFRQWLDQNPWSVYLGSGLATHVYGSWRVLVGNLCTACGIPLEKSISGISPERLLELADAALNANKQVYQKFLFGKFDPSLQAVDPRIYGTILSLPLESVFTTNFDHGLSALNESVARPRKIHAYPHLLGKDIGARGIFYLHGKPDSLDFNTDNLILGSAAFAKAYDQNSPLTRFLETLMMEVNVVVLGARLEEPPLRKLLAQMRVNNQRRKEDYRVSDGKKLIILPREVPALPEPKNCESSSDYQRQFETAVRELSELGFRVLTYDCPINPESGEQDHSELFKFIGEVSRRRAPRPAQDFGGGFNEIL